ncbi:FxsA family protein [Megalodesulfovibrio paquesii]
MLMRLFLLFTLVPALELYLLIKIGSAIGVLPTVAIVIGTGVAGAWLARREGAGVVMRIRQQMQQGIMPAGELLDGACILAAGVLLITPGFLSDLLGIALLAPPTRALLLGLVLRWYQRAVERGQIRVFRGGPGGRPTEPPPYDIDV